MMGPMISETRSIISFAARNLNRTERAALAGFLREDAQAATARELGLTRGGIFMAKEAGLKKLRKELNLMGIHCTEDLL